MSKREGTQPLLIQEDKISENAYWYQRFDSIKYYTNGVQGATVALFVFVLATGAFSMNNAMTEQNNIYGQLHAVPYAGIIGMPPSQYMSMDWIMTAKRVIGTAGHAFVGSAISRDMCVKGKENMCNPEWWQTTVGCNTSFATQLRLPPHVAEEQAYFYNSKRLKYRHLQPLFTCFTEKIGDVALYMNNEHSFSIGSTHNVNVLSAAVFLIFAVILGSMLLATSFTDKDGDIPQEYSKRVALTVIVLFYVMLTYSLATSKSMDATKDQHRPLGLASHAYSALFLFFSLLVFNQSGTMRDHTSEFMRINNKATDEGTDEDAEGQEKPPVTVYPAKEDDIFAITPVLVDPKNAFPMTQLNVRRFVQEPTHYDTRIKQVFIAPARELKEGEKPAPQHNVSVEVCALISNPVHSKYIYGQLLTLPLIMLALYMHGKNFGLDTYSQVVFIAAGIIAMVDVFLYRMWWAFQIHKGVTFFMNSDVGEYRAMEVLTFLCTGFQISIYTFLLTSDLFPKSYLWFFCVYIILTALAKIIAIVAIRQAKNPNKGKEDKGIASSKFDSMTGMLQKGDFYMFFMYVLSISIVMWVYVIGDQLKLDSEWIDTKPMVQRWGPGWQKYNIMGL